MAHALPGPAPSGGHGFARLLPQTPRLKEAAGDGLRSRPPPSARSSGKATSWAEVFTRWRFAHERRRLTEVPRKRLGDGTPAEAELSGRVPTLDVLKTRILRKGVKLLGGQGVLGVPSRREL